MNTAVIVQKLWNYCNVLRDDGMSYGDYVEQLTYLLFLKMADERSRPPYKQASLIPEPYVWPALLKRDGDDLFDHYRHTLEKLGAGKGTLVLSNVVSNVPAVMLLLPVAAHALAGPTREKRQN